MKVIQPSASGSGTIIPVTGAYILENLDALVAHSVPVFRARKKPDGLMVAERVDPQLARSLSEDQRDRKWFLLDRYWKQRLFEATDTMDDQLRPLLAQQPEQRAEAVKQLKTVLTYLKNQQAEPMAKAQTIMNTVSQAFLLNKASLKIKPVEVTVHEKSIAKDTESIVGLAMEMADDPALVGGLFASFQSLSNGQTVNHVLRVFATFTGFLKYYNLQHQNRFVQNLRRVFPTHYAAAYQRLLPKLEPHQLVSDHLLQLPYFEPHDARELALGAFLHDIGKMGNLDYFESDSSYDPVQIRQHVFLSAGLILMNYGNEHDRARLLAADHHNALSHRDGYGVTRMEREKGMRAPLEPELVLTSSSDQFVSGQALGYLPTEMLAVADVYDAMIDNSRTYKQAMTPAEAVAFLEDNMVRTGKLDPVLVDLYIDYLRANGVDVPKNRGYAAKFNRS